MRYFESFTLLVDAVKAAALPGSPRNPDIRFTLRFADRQLAKYREYGLLNRKLELTPWGMEAYKHYRSFMDSEAVRFGHKSAVPSIQ